MELADFRHVLDVLFEEIVQIDVEPFASGSRRVGLDFRVTAAKCRVNHVPSRKIAVKGIKIPREGPTKEIWRTSVDFPKGQRPKPHSTEAAGERVLDGFCKPEVSTSGEEVLAWRLVLIHDHLDRIKDVWHLLYLVYDD